MVEIEPEPLPEPDPEPLLPDPFPEPEPAPPTTEEVGVAVHLVQMVMVLVIKTVETDGVGRTEVEPFESVIVWPAGQVVKDVMTVTVTVPEGALLLEVMIMELLDAGTDAVEVTHLQALESWGPG